MCESSGSKFFKINTVIQSVLDTVKQSRPVATF